MLEKDSFPLKNPMPKSAALNFYCHLMTGGKSGVDQNVGNNVVVGVDNTSWHDSEIKDHMP